MKKQIRQMKIVSIYLFYVKFNLYFYSDFLQKYIININVSNILMLTGFTHEMTIKLLEIVQSKCHFLNDKMHSKKKFWADIGTEMQKNGYLVTYGRKAADKCHQRWRNLEKVYRRHCRYMKSTGTGKKKPPKYFEEMHEIIGEKHSSHPVHLLDSLHDTAASEICSIQAKSNEVIDNIEDSLDMGDESENIIKKKDYNLKKANSFENVKKSVRPKTDVSTVLKELHAQDMQIENERFEKFQALLVGQNELKRKTLEQRDKFLTVIKNVFNLEARKKSRKRKHSSDSN